MRCATSWEEPATKERPATAEIAPLTIIGSSWLPARRRMAAVPSCRAPETNAQTPKTARVVPASAPAAATASATDAARLTHRTWFAEIVRTAFADAGHVRPDDPTRHFIMLRDGAMVAGYLDGSEQAAATFVRGVDGLLRYIDTGG